MSEEIPLTPSQKIQVQMLTAIRQEVDQLKKERNTWRAEALAAREAIDKQIRFPDDKNFYVEMPPRDLINYWAKRAATNALGEK